MITTITGKNQVTVPAAIAAQTNMHPGTRLDWELAKQEGVLIEERVGDIAGDVTESIDVGGVFFDRCVMVANRHIANPPHADRPIPRILDVDAYGLGVFPLHSHDNLEAELLVPRTLKS